MKPLSHEPPIWVRDYIGLRFAEKGRTRAGLDCWGLARLVYLEQFRICLPSLAGRYEDTHDRAAIARVAAEMTAEKGAWAHVSEPTNPGDLGLFRGRVPHVGIAVSLSKMLHIEEGIDAGIEDFGGTVWGARCLGWYRWQGKVRVLARSRPIGASLTNREVPAGLNVTEMLRASGIDPMPGVRVFLGDSPIRREDWGRVRPKAGSLLTVGVIPEGGGGGSGKAIRIVATLAVLAAAIYAPYLIPGLTAEVGGITTVTAAGAFVSAGIALAGTLAIAALAPPPKPNLTGPSRNSPSLAGTRNTTRPYQVIPVTLGRVRMVPAYGANPHTEIVGDDQYLRLLFVIGKGKYELSDLRIGATPIDEFDGVEYQIRTGDADDAPCSLFPDTINEQSLSILLTNAGSWQTRTTTVGTTEISVDVTFPRGLGTISADGSVGNVTVDVDVQYSPTGAGTWVSVNGDGTIASPTEARGLDYLSRTPEVELLGVTTHATRISWGSGMPDAVPAYLPADAYSWVADGWLYAPTTGEYVFAIDCSDAGDLVVAGRTVASWYGGHAPAGAPSYTHAGAAVRLAEGYHQFRARVESRSGTGALAVGWQKPGDGSIATIPAANFFTGASGDVTAGLRARSYSFDDYIGTIATTSNQTSQARRSLAWAVPAGQYDVRVRRVTADTSSPTVVDTVYWTALRSISTEDPIRLAGVAKVAMRIRATDRLSGVVDDFNLMVQTVAPDWDAFQGRWITRATSSPAALYRYALQGSGVAQPVADARLDLHAIQLWEVLCAARGLQFNAIIDNARTVFEVLALIAAAGRASFGMRDGLFSVVPDQVQTVPVQHFTPHNSRGFSGRIVYPDRPHALRIGFLNADKEYQQDERIVLDDGYQLDGLDAFGVAAPSLPLATKFETLDLFGTVTATEAFKHGRYHIATLRLRPETVTLEVDVEQLLCNRGDLVLLNHDVMLVGLGSGRCAGQIVDGGRIIGMRLDTAVVMYAGQVYSMRFRLSDGTTLLKTLQTTEGELLAVYFNAAINVGDPAPDAGDLFLFGFSGHESREMIVQAIEPDSNLGAKLTLVDHAPAVHQADRGVIPPFDSGITTQPPWALAPEDPIIERIESDDFVMVRGIDGGLEPRILIVLQRPSSRRPIPNAAQIKTRPQTTTPGPWSWHPLVPLINRGATIGDVVQGVTYEIMLRVVTPTGLVSNWVSATHTVVGRSLPPPDVASFDVQQLVDGTRRYSWDLGTIPPDIAGVEIQVGPGGAGSWGAGMGPLQDGILDGASPDEMNIPVAAGYYRFGIKMIDTSGLESVNAIYVDRHLGPARREGVIVSSDARELNWPGTLTDCFKSNGPILEARSNTTWATLGVATWAAWHRWNLTPRSPIVYLHTDLDAGFVLDFEPSVYEEHTGTALVEFNYSEDNVTWAGWQNVADFEGVRVRGRYARYRITVTATVGQPIPTVSQFVCEMKAKSVEYVINSLATNGLSDTYRIAQGDFRLPVPPGRFSVIRDVAVSFNGSGAGWTWEVVDFNLSPGPRVRLYQSGFLQDASINATIRGI